MLDVERLVHHAFAMDRDRVAGRGVNIAFEMVPTTNREVIACVDLWTWSSLRDNRASRLLSFLRPWIGQLNGLPDVCAFGELFDRLLAKSLQVIWSPACH